MTLAEIAQEMAAEAAACDGKPIRRRLPNGLHLIMVQREKECQLSMTRHLLQPSFKEIELIQREFSVPKLATIEREQQQVNGQTYFVIRFKWQNFVQMGLWEIA